jgi:CubicO group peptidase (beta-lactamase class C family)
MILRKGEPVLTRTFGVADLSTGSLVTAGTNFRLASVSKQFTATAVLVLVGDERLGLDETLQDVFPDFPEYGAAIRVRHLLSHTSGLLDYESLLPDTLSVQVSDHDVLELMQEQESTYFPPGTEFRYSNTGYALLAMIVEARSGLSFSRFLRERILEPAGMHRSLAFQNGGPAVPERA